VGGSQAARALIYTAITSLDGYINDEHGEFAWSAPDEEVHAFVNDLERPVRTYLLGRRMYDVLKVWETMDDDAPVMRDYAEIWRAADKIVYSSTLAEPESARTTIERRFDADAVRRLEGPVSVGGATLAAEAFRAGLVDEVHLFLNPIVVGGGTRALPDGVRAGLELVGVDRFAGGVVHLHHRVS
jgi:dihydrofolate reductase